MSSQPPYDPDNPPIPPTQSTQQPVYPPSDPDGTPQPAYLSPGDPYAPQAGYTYPAPGPVVDSGGGQALAGLILGSIGLALIWVLFQFPFLRLSIPFLSLPIFDLSFFLSPPISIVGIILSARGQRSVKRRTLAIVGLALSILTLVFLLLLIALAAFSGFS